MGKDARRVVVKSKSNDKGEETSVKVVKEKDKWKVFCGVDG